MSTYSTWTCLQVKARSQHDMSFRPVGWFHFSIVTAHKFFVLPRNSDTWNIQKPAPHVLPILIPSTPHRPFVGARPRCGWQLWDPESRHGCPAGNAQSIPKRSSSCPHGLVCMAPSRHGSCQPRCESNAIKDKKTRPAGWRTSRSGTW